MLVVQAINIQNIILYWTNQLNVLDTSVIAPKILFLIILATARPWYMNHSCVRESVYPGVITPVIDQ